MNQDLNTPPLTTDESSAENRTEKFEQFPSVVEILRHTDKLFRGSTVTSKGLEGRNPAIVLAWCAYAYSQKSLSAPGGVVRNRLLENQVPPSLCQANWRTILPQDFLQALGLSSPISAEEDEGDEEDQAANTEEENEAESGPQLQVHMVTTTIDAIWRIVLDELKSEMQRGLFEQYVEYARPSRYDSNTLQIAVESAEAKAWLESRITSVVQRKLLGLLPEPVTVVFEVLSQEVHA